MSKSSSSLSGSDGNTSFLRAARAGHLDKVLEHLKSNIDINTSNANGLNALHLASKDGHVDVVAELLKRGATVDAATKKGNTALHIASLAGQEEVVKLLVNHGASVNVQSQNGFTPLYMAAQENHDNVVKYLLANAANQSLATEDGFTPLAVAMQQGHDKVVTVLLENDTRGKVRLPALHIAAKKDDVKAATLLLENDHNPDVTSKSGFTPLHIASHYGNESIANLLIQKKADVNYAAKHNITPLHVAAKWGKTNMVALLLEKGANIESKTRDGLTPLHCAARSGHEQVVDMLLEREAPISCKTKNGLAPLHMAAQGDHVDAARILLYHRAPVDEVTVDYLTALHVAAHCGHVRVAKLLLDRQADANARALNGFTPLHIACKKNRIKVVELLLKHGASISATTESGLTPLHVASFMGCMNIVIYLLQHDANPDVPTVRGETPLHLAARANQTDIIRILLRNGAQVDARAREQQTPLHIASRLGNVDIVMLLLQHGAKVDTTTKDMYTALHIAAKEGQDEVAGVLIDNGALLNATTKKGFTPLHLAAKYGHIKVAKLLLQREAPVDAQGKNGVTPLHVASHYDHQNVALLLLDKGASPHATAKNGHTPLHIAAKKNQMDIANTLLEYGAKPNAESKAGFTPLHLSAQEGHVDMSSLLIEHEADTNHQAKNGLTPLHLCAQEDRVPVAEVLVKNNAVVDKTTKAGYTPLHVACHYGQNNMVKFLLSNGADVKTTTAIGYTPLHQAAQQGHTNIVNVLLENKAQPNATTNNGQTPLHIAQKLGYITVIETLKVVTEPPTTTPTSEEKYKVVAPEAMHETFMSDSEEEGGEDTMLGDNVYRYLTADEMKSLGDDSLPIDVTRDERIDSNKMVTSSDSNMLPPQAIEDSISPQHIQNNYTEYIKKYTPDNVDIARHPINIGFLVSFLVDARGGAMRGCRHSGVRVIVPPRSAGSPTRITCRYVRPQRTPHPPPLMEGEALASRVLELGPVGAKFLGPVIIEVPHFAALRGKEREIVILRSDNGETWREHTVESSEDILNDVLNESFEADEISQLEDTSSGRITRILTTDFPQYFAVVSRIRQEVHAIGPEGGMVSSTVVPQVQAVFPQGALTKKIKVGLQAQPIDPELTAKLLGHGVAVSPVVTVEPRRRKFHKAITLSMPAPRAHSQGMINQYSGSTPTLRLLCSITGGTTRAQWEDVTGSTPLTFVNDCVSFTTTVSARFWLMDCRNVGDATKMATELYREAIHVPFMAKFVVFAKRIDPLEARLRVFCMTDDKEDKTLEHQEHFTEVAKSRDVEVLEGKPQYIEFAGNLVPITKSGEQLQFAFRAFRENRLPFSVRVKDQHAEAIGRSLFMRESKVPKGEPPQQPICILNIVLPDDIVADTISLTDGETLKRHEFLKDGYDYYRPDPRLADMSNLLGEDWVPLATQLGLTTSEINVIKSEYPDSVAKQAQSMLRMWISQSSNRSQGDVLENALKRIGREDIIPQCLNEDQEIIKKEEPVKFRTKKDSFEDRDIMKDSESVESLVLKEDKTKKRGTYDKYSAEEKVVEEPSDEEDLTNKTVTERRELIEKRLSVDRTIPASSQRVEIVQEISSIKRSSIVEDKIAEVEHQKKLSPPEVKEVDEDNVEEDAPKVTVSPAAVDTITTKQTTITTTTTKDEKPEVKSTTTVTTTVTETRTTEISDVTHKPEITDRKADELLEEVTHVLETKKVVPTISADRDPTSPKFSKTPPPSPADFILREKAATVQEWEASGRKGRSPDEPIQAQQSVDEDVEKQGIASPTTVLKTDAETLDNKLKDTTSAFTTAESLPEPLDASSKDEDKKHKKGFFGTLKNIVSKSFDHSDSETSEKTQKKDKKKKKKDKKPEEITETTPKKPRLPTPPEYDNIPFVEASPIPERKIEISDTKIVTSINGKLEVSIPKAIDNTEKEVFEEEKQPPKANSELFEDTNYIPTASEAIDSSLFLPEDDSEKIKMTTYNLIQNEINFPGWADDKYNVYKPTKQPTSQKMKRKHGKLFGFLGKKSSKEVDDSDDEKQDHSIVEKQDRESSKEKPEDSKKPGFFNVFGKKNKKEDDDKTESSESKEKKPSKVTLSESTAISMKQSDDFLKDEVENYEDVKVIVAATEPEATIKDEEEKSEKRKSGIFSGIFGKKDKKDSTDISDAEEKSPVELIERAIEEVKIAKKEKSPTVEELKKTEAFDVKPEIESKSKIELSDITILNMNQTTDFLNDEIAHFEDVRPIGKLEEPIADVKDIEEKAEKRKSGIFSGIFSKKDMKELPEESQVLEVDKVKTIIDSADKKPVEKVTTAKENIPIQLGDQVIQEMKSTTDFLNQEVTCFEDVKPTGKIEESIADVKDEEEKVEKRKSGIFSGIFSKKDKKELPEETNVEEVDKVKTTIDSEDKKRDEKVSTAKENIPIQLRDQVIQDMKSTTDFLNQEVTRFEDVKPTGKIKESIADVKDEEEKVEKRKSGIFSGIFGKKDKKELLEETKVVEVDKIKTIIDAEDKIRPEKVPTAKENIPIQVGGQAIQDMKSTTDFLVQEVSRFEDVKPIIFASVDTKEEICVSATKEKEKGEKMKLVKSPIFGKKEKAEKGSVSPEKQFSPEKVKVEEESKEKRKSGLFGNIFGKKDKKEDSEEKDKHLEKKTEDIPVETQMVAEEKALIVVDQNILENITNTKQFINEEVSRYEDVRPIIPTSEDVNERIIIQPTEIIKSITEPHMEETKVIVEETKEKQVPPKPIRTSKLLDKTGTAIEEMKNTNDFLNEEIARFEDVRPVIQKLDQPVTTATETMPEIKTIKSPIVEVKKPKQEVKLKNEEEKREKRKSGIFSGIFGKKEKDSDISTITPEPHEAPKKEIQLDKSVLEDMKNTENFLKEEVLRFEDVKVVIKQLEPAEQVEDVTEKGEKIIEDLNKVSDSVKPDEFEKAEHENKEKRKSGIFSGIFGKKEKSPDDLKTEPAPAPAPALNEKVIEDMKVTNDFLAKEINKFEDVRPILKTEVTIIQSKISPIVKTTEISEQTTKVIDVDESLKKEEDALQEESKSEKRKSGLFSGIFGKKEKKDAEEKEKQEKPPQPDSKSKMRTPIFGKKPAKIPLSEAVVKDMENTTDFLKSEVDNYDDVKPVTATEEIIETATEDVIVDTNVEDNLSPKKGIFKIFSKKDKKDDQASKPLSDEVKKDIYDTTHFIKTEVENFEDMRFIPDVPIVPIATPRSQEQPTPKPRKKKSKLKRDSSESGDESDSSIKKRFSIFGKKSKPEAPTTIKEAASKESISHLPEPVCKEINETNSFLQTEINKYEDVMPVSIPISSPEIEVKTKSKKHKKKQKRDSSESGEESDSYSKTSKFKIFSKSKKDPKTPIIEATSKEEKLALSDDVIKEIKESNDFLKTEIENFHDVKTFMEIPKIEITEEPSPEEPKAKDKKQKKKLKRDSSESGEESDSTSKSRKFGIFKKKHIKKDIEEKSIKEAPSKEDKLDLSEEVLTNMKDTHSFITTEVKNYQDAKPIVKHKDSSPVKTKLKRDSSESGEESDSAAKKRSFKIFRKTDKKADEIKEAPSSEPDVVKGTVVLPQKIIHEISECRNFINQEVENYQDARPITEESAEQMEEDGSKKKGIFTLFGRKDKKESTDQPESVEEKKTIFMVVTKKHKEDGEVEVDKDQAAKTQRVTFKDTLNETESFLSTEKELYVDPGKPEAILVKTTVFESPDDIVKKSETEKVELKEFTEHKQEQVVKQHPVLKAEKKKKKGIIGKIFSGKSKDEEADIEEKKQNGDLPSEQKRSFIDFEDKANSIKDSDISTKETIKYTAEDMMNGIETFTTTIISDGKIMSSTEVKREKNLKVTDLDDAPKPKLKLDERYQEAKQSIDEKLHDGKNAFDKISEEIKETEFEADGKSKKIYSKIEEMKDEATGAVKTVKTDILYEVSTLKDIPEDLKKRMDELKKRALAEGDALKSVTITTHEEVKEKLADSDEIIDRQAKQSEIELSEGVGDINDFIKKAKEDANGAISDLINKSKEAGCKLAESQEEAAKSAEEPTTSAKEAAKPAEEAVKSAEEMVKVKADDIKESADKGKDELISDVKILEKKISEEAKGISEEVVETAKESKKKSKKFFSQIGDKFEKTKKSIIGKSKDTEDKTKEIITTLDNKAVEIKDVKMEIKEGVNESKRALSEINGDAEKSLEYAKKDEQKIRDQIEELTEIKTVKREPSAEKSVSREGSVDREGKKKSKGFFSQIGDQFEKTKKTITGKTKEAKKNVDEEVTKTKDDLQETSEKLTDNVKSIVDKSVADVKSVVESMNNDAEDSVGVLRDNIDESEKYVDGEIKKVGKKVEATGDKLDVELKQLGDEVESSASETKKKSKGILGKIGDKIDKKKKLITGKSKDAKDEIDKKLDQTCDVVEKIPSVINEAIVKKGDDVSKKVESAIYDVNIEEVNTNMSDTINDAGKKISGTIDDKLQKAGDVEIKTSAKEITDNLSTIKAKVEPSTDNIKGAVESIGETVGTLKEKTGEIDDIAKIKRDQAKGIIDITLEETGEKIKDLKHKTKEKGTKITEATLQMAEDIKDVKDNIVEKSEEAKDKLVSDINTIKQDAIETSDAIKSKSKQIVDNKVADINGEVEKLKEVTVDETKTVSKKLEDSIDDTKSTIKDVEASLVPSVYDVKDESTQKSKATTDDLAAKAKSIESNVETTMIGIADEVETAAKDVKKKSKGFLGKMGDKFEKTKKSLTRKVSDAKKEVDGEAVKVKKSSKEVKSKTLEKLKDTEDSMKESVKDVEKGAESVLSKTKQEIEMTTESAKEATAKTIKKVKDTKDDIEEGVKEVEKETVVKLSKIEQEFDKTEDSVKKTTAKTIEKVKDTKDYIKQGLEEVEKETMDTLSRTKQEFEKTQESAKETTKKAIETAIGSVEQGLQSTEDTLEAMTADGKKVVSGITTKVETVEGTIDQQLDAKLGTIKEGKDQIKHTKQELDQRIEDLKDIKKEGQKLQAEVKETTEGKVEDLKIVTENVEKEIKEIRESTVAAVTAAEKSTKCLMAETKDTIEELRTDSRDLVKHLATSGTEIEKDLKDTIIKSTEKPGGEIDEIKMPIQKLEKEDITKHAIDDAMEVAKETKDEIVAKLKLEQEYLTDKNDELKEDKDKKKKSKGFFGQIGDKISDKLDKSKKKVDDSKITISEDIDKVSNQISDTSSKKVAIIKEETQEVKDRIKEAKDDVKEEIDKTTEYAKVTTKEAIQKIDNSLHETAKIVSDDIQKTVDHTNDKIEISKLVGGAAEVADTAKISIKDKVDDTKTIVDKTTIDVSQKSEEVVSSSIENTTALLDKSKDKIEELADKVEDGVLKATSKVEKDVDILLDAGKESVEATTAKTDEIVGKTKVVIKDADIKLSDTLLKAEEGAEIATGVISMKAQSTVDDISAKTEKLMDDTKLSFVGAKDDAVKKIESVGEALTETKDEVVKSAKDALDISVDKLGKEIKEEKQKSKGFFSQLGDKISDKFDKSKKKVEDVTKDISDELEDNIDSKGKEVTTNVEAKIDEMKTSIEEVKTDVKQKAAEAIDAVENKQTQIKDKILKVESDAKSKVKEVEISAQIKAESINADIKDKTDEIKEHFYDASDKIDSIKSDVKDSIEKVKTVSKDTIKDVEMDAQDQVDKVKSTGAVKAQEISTTLKKGVDQIILTENNLLQSAEKKIEDTIETIVDVKDKIKKDLTKSDEGIKSDLDSKKEEISKDIQDMKEGVLDTVAEAKSEIQDNVKKVKDFSSAVEEDSKEIAKEVQKKSKGFFTQIGDKIGDTFEKKKKSIKKKKVDVTKQVEGDINAVKDDIDTLKKVATDKIDHAETTIKDEIQAVQTDTMDKMTNEKEIIIAEVKEKADMAKEILSKGALKAEEISTGSKFKLEDTKGAGRDVLDKGKTVVDDTSTLIDTTVQETITDLKEIKEKISDDINTTTNKVNENLASSGESIKFSVADAEELVETHIQKTKKDVLEGISTATSTTKQKIQEDVGKVEDLAIEVAKDAKKKSKGFFTQIGDKIGDKFEKKRRSIKKKGDDSKKQVEGGVTDVRSEIDKNLEELKENIDDLKESIQESKDGAIKKADDIKSGLKESTEEVEKVMQKGKEDIKSTLDKSNAEVKTVMQKGEEDVKSVLEKSKEVETTVQEGKKIAAKKIDEVKNQALDESKSVKDSFEDVSKEEKKKSKGFFSQIGDKIGDTLDKSKKKSVEIKKEIEEDVTVKTQDAKDAVGSLLSAGEKKLDGAEVIAVEDMKKVKEATTDKVNQIKEDIEKEKEAALKTDHIKDDVGKKGEELSKSIKEIKSELLQTKEDVKEVASKEKEILKDSVVDVGKSVNDEFSVIKGVKDEDYKKQIKEKKGKEVTFAANEFGELKHDTIDMKYKVVTKQESTEEEKRKGFFGQIGDKIEKTTKSIVGKSKETKGDVEKTIIKTVDIAKTDIDATKAVIDENKDLIRDDIADVKQNVEDLSKEVVVGKFDRIFEALEGTKEPVTEIVITPDSLDDSSEHKRKPLFRIESEDDSASEFNVSKRDSIRSNILDSLTEQKLKALVTDLDEMQKPRGTDDLDLKLEKLEKAIDSLEQVEDKMEGKLRRVERKFERMASDVIESEKKESNITTPEVEEKRETEYQKIVSQLSVEDVSDFQREYATLWDEQTFSHTDEWDSKTPESQADVVDLPQGEASVSWQHQETSTSTKKAEKDEASASTPEHSEQVTDQHQLSEEMKALLKEMEKESKK